MVKENARIDPLVVVSEFDDVCLGDARLDARARAIVEALASSPADSFPQQEATVAGREALYRFFSNPRVTMGKLLEGHVSATLRRCGGRSVVRLVHDSSSFTFAGEREGLGLLRGSQRGFFGHVTLAIAADETRQPLGVLAASAFIHAQAENNRGMSMPERKKLVRSKRREEKESSRWERQALAAAELLPVETRGIHVMDQEADDFIVIAELHRAGLDFVIRVDPKRRAADGNEVRAVLADNPALLFRTVHVPPRPKKKTAGNFSNSRDRRDRPERNAELEIRWGAVSIARGYGVETDVAEVSLNAVHVTERNTPLGEEPIEWMLFTSEKVCSLEDATAVVDHYRARWVIEEYFKALKTGCAIEKRQLTSYDGLTRAFALFLPIAWHMLTLRLLARIEPSRAASTVLDEDQLRLLALMLGKISRALPDRPTVRDAMLGIAALGGHIRNNGDPGWQVLGRGYLKFADAEVGWRLARSDQS